MNICVFTMNHRLQLYSTDASLTRSLLINHDLDSVVLLKLMHVFYMHNILLC